MSLFIPPTAANIAEFVRKVAIAVNSLLRGNVFPAAATPPPDPQPGQAWFDTGAGKAKVWDGSTWQSLW